MEKIMITGALGQIGTELTLKLREIYGVDNVLATDLRHPEAGAKVLEGPFEELDVTDAERMDKLASDFNADTIMHMAALLSATAEKDPVFAWNLNMGGLLNALEVARKYNMQFFTPSSIGAFGPSTPADNTPQVTVQRPTTMYGVNKVSGELLCDYYFHRFNVDTRGVRFPGLISHVKEPGGGTTDYAVEIYFKAIREGKYTSYINSGTFMDMMFMDDAIDAIIKLMEAPSKNLKDRNAFNVTAMSVDPEMIAASIRKLVPDFELDYDVDPVREGIAQSWPDSIDATEAKKQWGFDPKFDLDAMTKEMLNAIKLKENK
ncbi:NAD-dependent epimerase/dehydratase family protein [Macrococcoides caseolyticum]|uniref:NAD-dependent epimerase/dehydratase family protein n=1 Tax=Macrococcus psychrotolerans TaxID=3039389 RepID=A0AAT9P3P1_9STAP|nr:MULTISPECIES: NAD-dependent epimerase/dehydratase family protein [Macrococcus]MBQ5152255.1 NAD-dependent epimerase/dehydratase family protein [Macrococcus caseolyticus]MDJ1112103.1 NAD-dependent epimerase/dehydratase family protein [Macrococcus sp. S115]QYA32758.1 NAD-dependent epimerase/dehydratase family protein [Macrococcus sp. 19Msa1099]QYA37570.1 NAD-dependent epimerase/dehydratase family protein [Macrococcus caseolyticus]QYA76277.1 NAD-dependent epimerase/dehydratase family protein [M